MSTFTLALPATSWINQPSAYGIANWSAVDPTINAVIPASTGTIWIIWFLKSSSVPAGQAFNGIKLSGGNDFTVLPGTGITRVATLYTNLFNAYTGFSGQAGTAQDSWVGTGTGHNANFVVTKAGFTSTDLNNGTLCLGMAVATDGANPGNPGTFRIGPTSATAYFGADVPNPPAGTISCTLTNPSGNYAPGKVTGQQFAALDVSIQQVLPQSQASITWTINGPAGIKFVASNNQTFSVNKGTVNDPGDPYHSNSGVISIAQGTPAGNYSISAFVQINSPNQSQTLVGNLNVVQNAAGGLFSEF